uniref:F-box domain-containing protein n=1 Tax=Kalanchoe fedtschenkoi TaxID=63787 RepID=A0A7N0TYB0_KALFE
MNDVKYCEELAEDVICLILLNLPVKSLLRFRSVSKSWNDIITSRAFAKFHCRIAHSNPRTYHLFKQVLLYNEEETLHYTTLNDHVSSACCGGGRLPPPPLKFQLPLKLKRKGGFWFDSSSWDGMMCTPTYEPDHTAAIHVWNPFTRQVRRVSWPVAYTEYQTILYSFVGFGYDHTADDYKIVVHTHDFSVSASRTFVMALRSSNDAWRSIDGLSVSWGSRRSKAVTLENGDVHWVSWSNGAMSNNIKEEYYWVSRINNLEGRFLILKFSFADEQLTILPSPPKNHTADEIMWAWQLGQYEGSLCFFNYRIRAHQIHWINIWTLSAARDHNGSNKATWVNVMHVPFAPIGYERLIPLGFTVSGDLLIGITDDDDRHLMVYLAGEDRFVVVRLIDDAEVGSARAIYYHLLHTESLISPK